MPPTGDTAKWDRWRPTAPLIWLALGLAVVGIFAFAVGALHIPAMPFPK